VKPDDEPAAGLVAVVPDAHRMQRRARAQREHRRPGRQSGRLTEQVDADAGGPQVAIGEERHQPGAAQPLGQDIEQVAVTAGQRQDLHAQTLAVGQEAVIEPLGSQSLGDGHHRGAGKAGPGAGVVPVAHVHQGSDDAATGAERVPQEVLVLHPHRGHDPVPAPVRQPERVTPVAQVGAHGQARERAKVVVRRLGPRASQVRLELHNRRRTSSPRHVGDAPENRVRHCLGQAPDCRPADGVGTVDQPVAHARDVQGVPGVSAKACRRTVMARCTIVTVLPTARNQSASSRT
jgi:hypothetical protein